ncbi:hypothetical protein ACHWQZ_G009696 [Mnemiopsis leidyi]
MVIRKQALVLSILCHVIFTKEQFKTHFIGCYKYGSYLNEGWEEYKLLTTDIFRECETRARNESWKVFGVNKDPLCFGSVDSFKLSEEANKECPNKEMNGVSAAIGNSGWLAIHQIVEYKTVALQKESDGKIECEDDHVFVLSEALLSGPESNCVSEEETKNITSSALNWCKGSRDCTVDSNDMKEGGCSYSLINITYGCLIDIGGGANDFLLLDVLLAISDHWVYLFGFIVSITALIILYRSRIRYLRDAPREIRECFWSVHQTLPCLRFYPSDATDPHSMFLNNPAHTANNPAHTANNSAHTANYSPYTANYPAHTANYPAQTAAPGFSSNVPSYIPGNVPPPSYDEVTASNTGGREPTSGGWFNKMLR